MLRISLPQLSLMLLSTLGATLIGSATRAVQLSDGTVYFVQPPQLVRATPTFREPYAFSTYLFTLKVPENAGEPLQKVTIAQQAQVETIDFDLGRSYAFIGNRDRGPAVNVVAAANPDNRAITITFNPPVPAGQTVTVGLQARNPSFGGIYLFGVTAFPPGEKSFGQFLGYGRLQFTPPGGRSR